MTLRRIAATFGVELGHSVRRPLFIMLALILFLSAWGLSSGAVSISSGDTSVGGTKAWITSQFAQTQTLTYITLLYFAFFIAVAAGLTLLRDRETKVDALLHSTPLTAGEYVWGRFAAVVAGFAILLAWHVAMTALFNHLVPNANAKEIRGPFALANYLVPAVLIGLPFFVFFTGVSMYVGERTRNAILVFVFPVATLLLCGFFLWEWAPTWLDPNVNRLLQVIEPSGYRWLNETHLKVDKGVAFYNKHAVTYDALFWINRAWIVAAGLLAVVLTQRSVERAARGVEGSKKAALASRAAVAAAAPELADIERPGVSKIGMRSETPSFLGSTWTVARSELHELSRQPGVYMFVLIILIQVLGNTLLAYGAFDTPILLTPGTIAVATVRQLSLIGCLLLMYYIVESHERDRTSGLAPILYASPVRTGALLLGKTIANTFIILVILSGALIAGIIAQAVQHTVPFSATPYVLIWGLLLLPTFLAWMAFVTAIYAAVGNRYGTYALALGALIYCGYRYLTGKMTWAGNWGLWGSVRWSDLGIFETDRTALVWNRVGVFGLAVFFMVVAVRLFGRRGADAVRTMHRMAPGRAFRTGLRLLPVAAVPVVSCVVLIFLVDQGLDGGVARKAGKDYWAKNLKTWFGAPLPDIGRVDVRLRLDPKRHWLSSEGSFTLRNGLDSTLASIPLTGGLFWDSLTWTMNGVPVKPEDDQHLFVFTPPRPLAKGDTVVIGWKWNGRFPGGVTRNGGNTEEFVLPSGVVLTGFKPTFMPVLGFMDDIGEMKENKTEPRRLPRDYWKGITRASYGATAWFPARITITGPADYTLNSVGVCTRNTVEKGWRTQVWETDHDVKILNVICGRWKVKQGHGTTIYYSAQHPYNVDEMSTTLDAARRWYSEWFLPYPWKELKLSEFPALAGYAQGFGTNITFSENIGFLTRNDDKTDATFLVTAHEAAHQWWGNILTPADGPGGDFLSEGMAHFSTLLLFDQVKGPRGRMEFAKGLESRYGDRRRPDEERPMYDIDGKRPSDETVMYDRGGWVFWMLYDFLGKERAQEGYRHFIQTWSVGRDHPALQDFVAAMRPYAADPAAYDAFTKEWFEEKAMPQYQVASAKKTKAAGGYDVTVTVRNMGTGRMPVEVAAVAGERWKGATKSSTRNPDYRESRGTVVLGGGESKSLTLHCAFTPENVVVDPDVRVLQLKRKQAVAKL